MGDQMLEQILGRFAVLSGPLRVRQHVFAALDIHTHRAASLP
jgi:hypothetical protein